ncbi:MAG: hypothetical protein D8M59_03975 [Planctomycetes bacterium]|nr:hypothetical protein [Planctomycetota bacterium]NOG55665.1 hypothetical protein [Planctomycetota bacterium]
MKHGNLRTATLAAVTFGAFALTTASQAQQIPDRATLDAMLGANKIEDDFENYNVAFGGAENLDTYTLDSSTVANGQGPGLVNAGATYSDPSATQLQWNGDTYFSLQTRTLLANGSLGSIDIKYDANCSAMGIDLRAFSGYGYSGTVDIYDLGGSLVGSVPFSLSSGGAENAFVGWQHDPGISYVSIYSSNFGWSPVIDNHAYGTTGFSLAVTGDCPGVMTASATGATPNAWVGFGYGYRSGQTKVPGCPGLYLDIDRAKEGGRAKADANGDASIQGRVPAGACGRVIVQAADLEACETSNVVGI